MPAIATIDPAPLEQRLLDYSILQGRSLSRTVAFELSCGHGPILLPSPSSQAVTKMTPAMRSVFGLCAASFASRMIAASRRPTVANGYSSTMTPGMSAGSCDSFAIAEDAALNDIF